MAQAKRTKSLNVKLKLSALEAETLMRLLGHHIIGTDLGPRGVTNGIWDALKSAAIGDEDNEPLPCFGDANCLDLREWNDEAQDLAA